MIIQRRIIQEFPSILYTRKIPRDSIKRKKEKEKQDNKGYARRSYLHMTTHKKNQRKLEYGRKYQALPTDNDHF